MLKISDLSIEQQDILNQSLDHMLNSWGTPMTISGPPGSGKTSLIPFIIDGLKSLNKSHVICLAPTHKAVSQIEHNVRHVTCNTIHQFLGLKPDYNILDFNLNDIKFIKKNPVWNQSIDLIIVDECSMINDELYDELLKYIFGHYGNIQVLFQGDIAQLAPVKSKKLSKAFTEGFQLKLTGQHRSQNDNLLLIQKARNELITEFSDTESLKTYDNWRNLLNDNIELYKDMLRSKKTIEYVKLLAYTNKRVDAFNNEIRKLLFGNELMEYNIGDLITVKSDDTWQTFQISSVDIQIRYFDGARIYNYVLETTDDFSLSVLSKYNDKSVFDYLAKSVEYLRLKAIKTKLGNDWRKYYVKLHNIFSPIDIYIDNRVVIKKNIDFIYATTVHRAQGSSIDNVLIDMGNIFTCKSPEELKQLQYVALSRVRHNLHILK